MISNFNSGLKDEMVQYAAKLNTKCKSGYWILICVGDMKEDLLKMLLPLNGSLIGVLIMCGRDTFCPRTVGITT